ncbi:MAG: hypothetical protein ACD_8C00124G0050 [uncultured bacterium]|nr:MAG: hypothetical protein ACD_8C00124G0050 [uncultured bacterium]
MLEFSSLKHSGARFRVVGLDKVAQRDVILKKLSHPIRFVIPLFKKESPSLNAGIITDIDCCDINAVDDNGVFYAIPLNATIEIVD